VDGMQNASTVLSGCGGYIGRSVDLTIVEVQSVWGCAAGHCDICTAVLFRMSCPDSVLPLCTTRSIRNPSDGLSQFCDGAGACAFRNPHNWWVRSAYWKHENVG